MKIMKYLLETYEISLVNLWNNTRNHFKYVQDTNQYLQGTHQISLGHRPNIYRTLIIYLQDKF